MSQNNAKSIGFTSTHFYTAVLFLFVLGGVAVAGIVGSGKERFLQSYLFGWTFWMMLALGCLGFQLLIHTIRPAWGLSVLRIFEAGGGPWSFVALGVAFVPILMNAGTVYHWTHPEYMSQHAALEFKKWFLNDAGFLLRNVGYFLFWLGLAAYMRRSTLKQDQTKEEGLAVWRTSIAAPSILFFVLSITFAVTDWLMSLDAHWFSTIFGVWLMVGGALTAISFATLVVMRSAGKEPIKAIMHPALSRDLGNMIFVFTLLWGYTSLSQFLIIWAGNLPEFISFFTHRGHSSWGFLSLVLIFGQFMVPFVLLMAPRTKAVPQILAAVASYILLMRLVDVYWIVIPFFERENAIPIGSDFIGLLAVGALWFAVFLNQIQKGALLPEYSHRLAEAYNHA